MRRSAICLCARRYASVEAGLVKWILESYAFVHAAVSRSGGGRIESILPIGVYGQIVLICALSGLSGTPGVPR